MDANEAVLAGRYRAGLQLQPRNSSASAKRVDLGKPLQIQGAVCLNDQKWLSGRGFHQSGQFPFERLWGHQLLAEKQTTFPVHHQNLPIRSRD